MTDTRRADTVEAAEVVKRLRSARALEDQLKTALMALAHSIISKEPLASEHCKGLLDLLAAYEVPAREAADLIERLRALEVVSRQRGEDYSADSIAAAIRHLRNAIPDRKLSEKLE